MAEDLKVNSNTDILEFKRKFNLFVSNYDKGEFDGDFEITGDLDVGGDVEITGDLEIKGDLVGAESQIANAVSTYIGSHPFAPEMLEGEDVDCKSLTADSIVEKMTGYSYTLETSLDLTIIYASACKNGNKLTFVIFGTYVKNEGDDNYGELGTFGIPASVAAKLYPYTIDGLDVLDAKFQTFYSGLATKIDNPIRLIKQGNGVRFYLSNANNAVVGTTYFFRVEETFLLSDNMYTPGE